MKMKKKFSVTTLGCRTNQYESAAYVKQLKDKGYIEAELNQQADLCIINTCTVTEGADSSSRQQIRQIARKHPHAKIVVTGCLADRLPSEIGAMPEVSEVVPNKDKESLLPQIFPEEEWPEFAIDHFGGHTRAFVKVQDGCNSFCTYCIIPYVRGRSRSRKVEAILREVETLVTKGYKEVVITGVNVGDFDGAPEPGEPPVPLATLVRQIDQIDGLKRIRISSIDPDEVDDDLLDAVIHGKKTCHSMHIVLQAGSNAILKRMNRKYTRQMFMEAIDRCRAASPHFTFTTDIIVGFPGETEADFLETLDLMRRVRFAKVHMFPYSPRDRTRAALYKDRVPPKLVAERKQTLLRLAEEIAFQLRSEYIGQTLPVLLEAPDKEHQGHFTGHTENFLLVSVPVSDERSNDIVTVEITANTPGGLIGQIQKPSLALY